ncbi:MAG: T9SS type A sorting domain-containing protein [Flavobacteriia bacterium]|nr:T9SS type A sorting domain-containing protein [Flavobacteriia bacterium]
MAGAETYFIEINGRLSTVSDNRFNLDLKPGLNTIKVSTPLDCQGIFEKEIFISESLTYYPNPVIDVLNVIIPGKDELVGVQVYTDAGMKVLDKKEEVSFDRSILLNLNRLKSGVYIININGKTVAKEFKIIKK